MSQVWYRARGTRSLDTRPPCNYDLWYRIDAHGRPECTSHGSSDWRAPVRSVEFDTVESLIASGVCIRVSEVGKRTPYDEDMAVDEGL